MTMRNISSTSEEIYQTQNGNVRVERYGKRQWKVWPIGSRPSVSLSRSTVIAVDFATSTRPTSRQRR